MTVSAAPAQVRTRASAAEVPRPFRASPSRAAQSASGTPAATTAATAAERATARSSSAWSITPRLRLVTGLLLDALEADADVDLVAEGLLELVHAEVAALEHQVGGEAGASDAAGE